MKRPGSVQRQIPSVKWTFFKPQFHFCVKLGSQVPNRTCLLLYKMVSGECPAVFYLKTLADYCEFKDFIWLFRAFKNFQDLSNWFRTFDNLSGPLVIFNKFIEWLKKNFRTYCQNPNHNSTDLYSGRSSKLDPPGENNDEG